MRRTIGAILPYFWALGAVALCVIVKCLSPVLGQSNPYLIFALGVILIAYNFGFWPGVATAVVSTLAGDFFFVKPYDALFFDHQELTRALSFAVQAVVISYICGVRLRVNRDKLGALAGERRARVELERTTQALVESEERYRAVLESIQHIIVVAGPGFVCEWLNDRWYAFTGLSEEKSLGNGWLTAIESEDRTVVTRSLERAETEASALNLEFKLADADGAFRWHLMRAVPILDANRKVTRWFGTCTDIHEKKILEHEMMGLNEQLEVRVAARTSELLAANRALETANQELEAFCYSVSHDLRTPLRGIDGFARAVLEDYGDVLPADAHDYLARVRAGAKRMDELITALLKLSRIARQDVTPVEIDLSRMVEEVIVAARTELGGRQVEFVVEPGLTTRADSRLARIVIENLLNNAIKFSGSRDHALIEFGSIKADPPEVFYFRDNGVGFNPEYENKLFQPFERLHSPKDYPGSGIGLATVARAVKKHGGQVWAESIEHKGATFYFSFSATSVPVIGASGIVTASEKAG